MSADVSQGEHLVSQEEGPVYRTSQPATGKPTDQQTNLDSCTEVRKIVRMDLYAGGQPPPKPHILQLPLKVEHRVHARRGGKRGERTIVGQSRD